MNNTLIIIGIISISTLIYYISNIIVFKNEVKKLTYDYKTYFYKEHINKHPVLYLFFTHFIFIYNSYHKDEFEYGYLKYKVEKIENAKNDPYLQIISNSVDYNLNIIGEDEIRRKLYQCELKIKLKKLKKLNI